MTDDLVTGARLLLADQEGKEQPVVYYGLDCNQPVFQVAGKFKRLRILADKLRDDTDGTEYKVAA